MFAEFPTKAIIYLAIITALIAGITAGYNAIEQSGYDRRQAEELSEFKDQIDAINAEHKDKLDAAIHEAKHYREAAILVQNQKPVVLTKIKEKIIHENINKNCTSIIGMSELFNTSLKRFDI